MMMPIALGLLLLILPMTAEAQDRAARAPVIDGFGSTHTMPGSAEPPSRRLRYRAVFNVTMAPPAPDRVNPALERIARFLNLLGEAGIRPRPGDLVAIVHGPATHLVMTDQAYAARTGAARNPNLPLLRRLREAGVVVAVCSQALHGQSVARDQVADGVRIDVSALTTLANLQLRGYALIPN